MLTVATLLSRISTAIAAIDGSTWDQGDTSANFHAARVVDPDALDGSLLEHLAFVAIAPTTTAMEAQPIRGRQIPAEGAHVETEVLVALSYRIRHDDQVSDYALAMGAIQRTIQAVISIDRTGLPGLILRSSEHRIGAENILRARLRFRALHLYDLTA